MKKALALILACLMIMSMFIGCAKTETPAEKPAEAPAETPAEAPAEETPAEETPAEAPAEETPVAHNMTLLVVGGTLGDQANNDGLHAGMTAYAEEKGYTYNAIELAEVADIDATCRQVIANGCDLIMFNSSDGADMMDDLCPEFPDVHFVMYNGTNQGGYENLLNIDTDTAGAAFLCGIFATKMNEAVNGQLKCGYIGGVRNPNLERARYSMQAAAELLGGELNAVYVGSFNDAAAAKEITQQMHSDGVAVVQAWAGGCNKGVFEAAETAGEGHYSMGGATGQFHMSDTIVASLATKLELAMAKVCEAVYSGTQTSGTYQLTVAEGTIDCVFAPDERADAIPEDVKAVVEEYRQKLINGELFAPKTEEEYNDFVAKFLNG